MRRWLSPERSQNTSAREPSPLTNSSAGGATDGDRAVRSASSRQPATWRRWPVKGTVTARVRVTVALGASPASPRHTSTAGPSPSNCAVLSDGTRASRLRVFATRPPSSTGNGSVAPSGSEVASRAVSTSRGSMRARAPPGASGPATSSELASTRPLGSVRVSPPPC